MTPSPGGMDETGLSTGLRAFHPERVGNTKLRAFDPFKPQDNRVLRTVPFLFLPAVGKQTPWQVLTPVLPSL